MTVSFINLRKISLTLIAGTNFYAARRTATMQDSETFFSWQEVREKYREGIKIVFERVKTFHPTAQKVR